MQWMEIAYADVGVTEVAGVRASETILEYFRRVGRADITSDEVAWCAAFAGAVLKSAGVKFALPKGRELLASSFLEVGTPIDQPRVGAIACVPRSGGSGWHVAFVSGWDATRLRLLGGNQRDSVCEAWFLRDGAELRWPGEPVTAAALADGTSRIATAAKAQQKDGAKAGGIEVADIGLEAGGLKEWAAQAADWQASATTIEQFMTYAVSKGKWVAGALALYWLARMAWRAGWIKHWRAQDANEGKTV